MAEAPERSGKPTEWAFPASFAQERVWIAASQREPGSPLYTLVGLVPLELPLEPPDVEAALAEVVGRHEALRTDFRVEEGALAQVVHASVPVRVRRVDLQSLAPAEREQRLAELHAELGRAPLPLDRAPLWRAVLVRFEATRWGLLFAAHHAIFDGVSYVNLSVVGPHLVDSSLSTLRFVVSASKACRNASIVTSASGGDAVHESGQFHSGCGEP